MMFGMVIRGVAKQERVKRIYPLCPSLNLKRLGMRWNYFWGIKYLANVEKPLKIVNVTLCLHNHVALFAVATPLWVKCEDETHIPKSGNLESSGTPENSELEFRGQNTLHWGVPYTIEKVLKCRCPKWPRMSHLDICSSSYGQKKGRESNW
jgi:hypothetical protein